MIRSQVICYLLIPDFLPHCGIMVLWNYHCPYKLVTVLLKHNQRNKRYSCPFQYGIKALTLNLAFSRCENGKDQYRFISFNNCNVFGNSKPIKTQRTSNREKIHSKPPLKIPNCHIYEWDNSFHNGTLPILASCTTIPRYRQESRIINEKFDFQ